MKKLTIFALLLILPISLFLSCDDDKSVLETENIPPNPPSNPSPADSAAGVSTASVTLSWECTDPNWDDLTYTLTWYLAPIYQSGDTVTGLTTANYALNEIYPAIHYRWKITAWDEHGAYRNGPYWNFYTEDKVVNFGDINLELSVRQAIAKPFGDIYASEINTLNSFDAGHSGINSLTGLEYMFGLGYLQLQSNLISDVSPLSSLIWLSYLQLDDNQVGDIQPLCAMSQLQTLYLENNYITDVSPLSELTNLETLDLSYNQISDVSPLSGLRSLRILGIRQNQISDISPLSQLTLMETLWLDDNQISDISPLSELILIEDLWLTDNQITNI